MVAVTASPMIVVSKDELLEHWQGHRRVTRRLLAAFPEPELFNYSIGGMRPAAKLALELIGMADGGIRGLASREWDDGNEMYAKYPMPSTKAELLQMWDRVTEQIDTLWPQIAPDRFGEIDKAFGVWEGRMFGIFQYWVDNEIHHRGQAYVYLRSLGIEPPAFYERG
jgi:uncharacterized damage-inducible protein DinB